MAQDLPAVSNGTKTVANGTTGRDARTGRFLPGNPGGGRPANPFGRYQRELRAAVLAAVSPTDLQAVVRTVLRLAKRGHVPSVELLLKWTLGGPPPAVDPDRIDEHELSVKRGRPTLIDELALAQTPSADDRETLPVPEAEANDADALNPPLRTVLAWAIQELAEAQTALRASPPPPPNPVAGWERFSASQLEWDAQAAVPVDVLFLAYARWSGAHGEPVLAEAPVLAWLTEKGATVCTGTYSQVTTVQGVRVLA
jgi:hypothetical protein